MAQVTLLTDAKIMQVTISAWRPSQVGLQNLASSVFVINRAYATWRGNVTFAKIDPYEDSLAAAMEAFFASLDGQANWFDLPLYRPTIADDATATVSSVVNATDGTISHNISADLSAAVGDWLAVGNRRYVVRKTTANGTQLTLDPQIPLEVGETIEDAANVRARV